MAEEKGRVWLAGAGPGDEGLLTLKTKQKMEEADVIVYDALISAEILSLIPDGKEWINVGKRSGHHSVPQEEINEILVRKAKQGKKVLRLKGGDPFVFGRGAEEAEMLRQEGIPFEIIPGVTSASAVPAYAGIPITYRDFASSFHVITGHAKQGKKMEIAYDALVKLDGTLVFLMGISAMEEICQGLIEAGMDKNMPAAVLEKGTTARQRTLVSTVGNLKRDAEQFGVQTPAIILIGRVCGLAKQFAWGEQLPLWGKQIVTTRPRQNSSRMAQKLRRKGARVIELPSITTKTIEQNVRLERALSDIRSTDGEKWLVFTSPIGVRTFWEQLRRLKTDVRGIFTERTKVAAIGTATAEGLSGRGIFADLVPDVYCAQKLGETLGKRARQGSRIWLLRAKEGSAALPEELEKAGFLPEDVPLYETVCRLPDALNGKLSRLLEAGEIDMVTFTSASTVRGFVQALPQADFGKLRAVCIGEQTAQEAARYGMRIEVSEKATMESMVQKILQLAAEDAR